MSQVIELNEDNIESVFSDRNLTGMIDFWAEWCGPCKAFAPIYEKSSANHPDIKHYKLDVDKFPAIAQQLNITAIPTLFAFSEGKALAAQAGALPPTQLEQFIQQHFS